MHPRDQVLWRRFKEALPYAVVAIAVGVILALLKPYVPRATGAADVVFVLMIFVGVLLMMIPWIFARRFVEHRAFWIVRYSGLIAFIAGLVLLTMTRSS